MFRFLKKKKAPPPKKVKNPVDIKKVSAQYKVVLKQERFRKDVRQIKEKNVIDFHNLRYYLQKQKPHLYRKKYKVMCAFSLPLKHKKINTANLVKNKKKIRKKIDTG